MKKHFKIPIKLKQHHHNTILCVVTYNDRSRVYQIWAERAEENPAELSFTWGFLRVQMRSDIYTKHCEAQPEAKAVFHVW